MLLSFYHSYGRRSFTCRLRMRLGAVPKPLRKSVPARENKGAQNAGAMTKPCDCSEDDPCASVKGAQGYVFPKIVHAGDPRLQ